MTPKAIEQESPDVREVLSFDAKCIAGAWFGLMTAGKGELTFGLQSVRPTERAMAALAELVEHGVVSVEKFNRFGGLVYTPLTDCRWGFDFLRSNEDNPAIKWAITEPITGGNAEVKRIIAACLRAKGPGHEH